MLGDGLGPARVLVMGGERGHVRRDGRVSLPLSSNLTWQSAHGLGMPPRQHEVRHVHACSRSNVPHGMRCAGHFPDLLGPCNDGRAILSCSSDSGAVWRNTCHVSALVAGTEAEIQESEEEIQFLVRLLAFALLWWFLTTQAISGEDHVGLNVIHPAGRVVCRPLARAIINLHPVSACCGDIATDI